MALPTSTQNSWTQGLDFPSRLLGTSTDDYELYESDGEFVLSIEMPGFDPADIDVSWHEGRLNVAAEQSEDQRNRHRTYHRTFRFPSEIDEEAITAEYRNGVLEVTLPAMDGVGAKGKTIEIES
jgi:HSP20 family protein